MCYILYMSIAQLLLPREKFSEAFDNYGQSPLTFEIEKEGQLLFYFGANHSHDPENYQYPVLREYWNRFLETTINKERLILVEDTQRSIQIDEVTAIKCGAEGDFVSFLGAQTNIKNISPDITLEKLAKKFPEIPEEEVLLYRFLDVVNAFQRHHLSSPFEDVVNNWCEDKKQKGFDVSLDKLKDLYKNILGKEFDLKDAMNNLVNPNNTGTRINEIARLLSDAREVNIVSEIEKYWKEGKSLFVVFGSGHLVVQRPALEKLLI